MFKKIILLILIIGQTTHGQTNKEKALEIGNQAVKLEDEGKYQDAIKLFEKAEKIDPEKLDYPYEIGWSYFQLKEYQKGIDIVEKLINHKDVEDVVYQLIGNGYDYLGNTEKAKKTYEAGLLKFPKSGKLYLEMGVIEKDLNKQLAYYEKGIEVAPKFTSNYYWATKIYCNSSEEIWGMIYGKIFINLERNSSRTSEISKLLFDTYKSEIKFTSETTAEISFSKNISVNVNDIGNNKNPKLPFAMIYEPTLLISIVNEKTINLNTLDNIRKNFILNYYKFGHDKTNPNVLFEYQKAILDSGNLEAYNHWLLLKGDEANFTKWQNANKDKWDNFVKWFSSNKIVINNTNKFTSN